MAYIADDANAGTGGALRNGPITASAWTQAYIILDPQLPSAAAAYHGLAGELDAATGNAVLFATTSDGTRLQQITDPLTAPSRQRLPT